MPPLKTHIFIIKIKNSVRKYFFLFLFKIAEIFIKELEKQLFLTFVTIKSNRFFIYVVR
jgi:hypothetical protein